MAEDKKTILVVDDVDELRDAFALILEYEGYNIKKASNGSEAMDVLSSMHVDLVVTDILMPEMDGMELVNSARQHYPDLKFVLVSGGGRQLDSDYDYLEVTRKLTGVTDILKKPFRPEELIKVVNNLLAN